ncbi:MAG: hypothetical protein KDA88_03035 [Planctomycetaceae bacterium]|nr:hypothetical protein [Planctomycetaceae bacterium]MCB9951179.1 hypothetical protein [Planctomycetaceae bacterium]
MTEPSAIVIAALITGIGGIVVAVLSRQQGGDASSSSQADLTRLINELRQELEAAKKGNSASVEKAVQDVAARLDKLPDGATSGKEVMKRDLVMELWYVRLCLFLNLACFAFAGISPEFQSVVFTPNESGSIWTALYVLTGAPTMLMTIFWAMILGDLISTFRKWLPGRVSIRTTGVFPNKNNA